MYVDNPRCSCAPAGVNRAYTQPGSISFYVDMIDDVHASRAQWWFDEGRGWWNNTLSWAGSGKRIEGWSGSGWPIREVPLPGDTYMQFTNIGGDQIQVDPRAFELSDEHARTLMAHELGHAIGVQNHSGCDEWSSIMASPINAAHNGLYDGDSCWLWSEYRSYSVSCIV